MILLLLVLACRTGGETGDGGGQAGSGRPSDTAGQDTGLEALDPATLPTAADPCRPAVLMEVTEVVDGDTAYMENEEGWEKVRFIGVDTPEIAHGDEAAECYGDIAADFTHQALDGRQVWLTFDRDCVDPYERTLAYVHTGAGEEGFFERVLLRGGYAEVLTFEGNDSFAEWFEEDAAAAQEADAGLWGACP